MINHMRSAIVSTILILVWAPAVSADEYSFITLRFSHGIQIDAPRSWRVLDERMSQLIATARDAALDLSGLGIRYAGNVVFAANSTPTTTYASVRITFDDIERATTEEIAVLQGALAADSAAVTQMFETAMRQLLDLQGLQLLTSIGVFSEQYGPYPGMSYRFRRSGPNGPVVVDAVQIWRRDATIRINLAYREAEEGIWKVVIARIKSSIVID